MITVPTRWIVYGVLVVAAIGGVWALHARAVDSGKVAGRAEIQKLWDADTKKRDAYVAELNTRLLKLTDAHITATGKITDELSQTKLAHQGELSRIGAEHADRLRKSTTREGIYRGMAEAGAVEQRALADHAAELDRSLVDGKRVAAVLRSTLEQRDREIILLGRQIIADRQSCTKPVTTTTNTN